MHLLGGRAEIMEESPVVELQPEPARRKVQARDGRIEAIEADHSDGFVI